MNVAQLMKALEGVSPETEVVVLGNDHSYRRVRDVVKRDASVHAWRWAYDYYEWYGKERADDGEVLVKVVVVV